MDGYRQEVGAVIDVRIGVPDPKTRMRSCSYARIARHPLESAFEEMGDYTKSLGTGRFAAQLTEIAN